MPAMQLAARVAQVPHPAEAQAALARARRLFELEALLDRVAPGSPRPTGPPIPPPQGKAAVGQGRQLAEEIRKSLDLQPPLPARRIRGGVACRRAERRHPTAAVASPATRCCRLCRGPHRHRTSGRPVRGRGSRGPPGGARRGRGRPVVPARHPERCHEVTPPPPLVLDASPLISFACSSAEAFRALGRVCGERAQRRRGSPPRATRSMPCSTRPCSAAVASSCSPSRASSRTSRTWHRSRPRSSDDARPRDRVPVRVSRSAAEPQTASGWRRRCCSCTALCL
jgi:hypothetical protein